MGNYLSSIANLFDILIRTDRKRRIKFNHELPDDDYEPLPKRSVRLFIIDKHHT